MTAGTRSDINRVFRTRAEDVSRAEMVADDGVFVQTSQYSMEHDHYATRSLTVFDTLVASGREAGLLTLSLQEADKATQQHDFSNASATLAYVAHDKVLHFARVSPHGQVVLYDYNHANRDLTGMRLMNERDGMPVKSTHTLGGRDAGKQFGISDAGAIDLKPFLREGHDIIIEVSDGLNGTGGDPDKALLARQNFVSRMLADDTLRRVNIAEEMMRHARKREDLSNAVVQVARIPKDLRHPVFMAVVRGRGTKSNEIADQAVQAIEHTATVAAQKSWERSFTTSQRPKRT